MLFPLTFCKTKLQTSKLVTPKGHLASKVEEGLKKFYSV